MKFKIALFCGILLSAFCQAQEPRKTWKSAETLSGLFDASQVMIQFEKLSSGSCEGILCGFCNPEFYSEISVFRVGDRHTFSADKTEIKSISPFFFDKLPPQNNKTLEGKATEIMISGSEINMTLAGLKVPPLENFQNLNWEIEVNGIEITFHQWGIFDHLAFGKPLRINFPSPKLVERNPDGSSFLIPGKPVAFEIKDNDSCASLKGTVLLVNP